MRGREHRWVYKDDWEVEHFIVLPEHRLRIFRNSNSFTDALTGCSGLFYNFQLPPHTTEYSEEMIRIEEEAALNAVVACTQIPSVTKFVLTSSLATAIWRPDAILIDHRTLSDEDYCRGTQNWYALAKRAAERVVERVVILFRERYPPRRFKEMTINSALVVDSHMDFINAESIIPYVDSFERALHMLFEGTFATVSINFLVDAHICVYETPNASARGRYLCFDEMVSSGEEATRLARRLRPVMPWTGELSFGQENWAPRLNGERLTALMAARHNRV